MKPSAAVRKRLVGPDRSQGVIRAIFFASGAAALAQEVLWMRRFTGLLGATAPAAAATLAGVFLGLALGGFLAARFAARVQHPLRAYGRLELVAALGALLVLPLLEGGAALLPSIRGALDGSPFIARLLETLLAALIVLLPATCMGATLPVVAPALGAGGGRTLYAWNLFGSVAGSLAVPFLLLPHLGVTGSYFVAVAISALAGGVALAASRTPTTTPPLPPQPQPSISVARSNDRRDTGDSLPAGALGFASGALLLGLESAYVRLFAQVHESSLHAFSAVLAAFLLALALGSLLAQFLARRRIDRGVALALCWLASAALLAVVPQLFHELTEGLAPLRGNSNKRLTSLLWLAALLLVPPVALAGAGLPLLLGPLQVAPDRARLGTLLGWNTIGSMVGPLIVTFGLFPTVGLFTSFAGAAIVLVVVAGTVLRRRVESAWQSRASLLTILLLAATIGLAFRPPPRVHLDAKAGESLVELVEGPLCIAATIAHPVSGAAEGGGAAGAGGDRASSFSLKIDNHYTLGGTLATGDLRQLGHLPLLLHPRPRRVAFLGLGTAITAGAATLHPVDTIDLVELLPETIGLARRHFADANLHVFDDPRARLHVDDARTFLRGQRGAFDVLVGDLVVPWRAGESALYTREHFEQARAALAEGGLYCQWIPADQLRREQLDSIIATFLDVFPRATLWRGDFFSALPTLGLIGHTVDIDPIAVASRAARLAPGLDAASPYLMHHAGVWLNCIGALDPKAPRWLESRRHTSDSPWLELAGPERGSGKDATTLIGHALDPLLARAAATPLVGTPLATLGPEELEWRRAGADLWRTSLLMHDGKGAEARTLWIATLEQLPQPLRDAVLGPR